MNLRSLLLCLSLLLYSSLSFSQKNNFTSYTVRSGLPQNTVYKIFQDSKGYLWLGTDGGGVSRFDGRTHRYFKKEDGLANNVVRDIIEDKEGNLWFATSGGLSVYNGIKFRTISKDEGLISNTVVKVFEDSEGRVWAGTTGGGLSLISLKDSAEVLNFGPEDGLSSDNVFSILQDRYGRLWLGFIGGPPQMINWDGEELKVQNLASTQNYNLNAIYCGALDEKGELWFGSIINGVFKLSFTEENAAPEISNYSILNGLKDNYILDIQPIGSSIWIATNDGGVHYLENDRLYSISTKDGLPGNQVIDLFSDQEENIWISCMGEGILKLNGFEFSHFSVQDGLLSDQVSYIKKQPNDSGIWIATYDKGLQKLTIANNKINSIQTILEEDEFHNTVRAFDFDANMNMWIATQNGLVVWNEGILATVGSDLIAGDKVNAIHCASDGWVWIGTSSGLSVYNGEYLVFREEDGFINNEIQTIIEATDGTMWIGTLGGLAKWKDGTMVTYDEVEGLSNVSVHSLVEAPNGNIIIGTYGGGLFTFDQSKDSLPILPLVGSEELTSSNIYSLTFQDDSTLIVGTDKGVDKLNLGSDLFIRSIHHFNENNGFLSIENNINAIYHDEQSGAIYFGTVNGLSRYQEELEVKTTYQPKLILQDIRLFNQDVNWKDWGEVNQDLLPVDLVLPHHKNFISFYFSTIYFKNPENIFYSYRLLGLSQEWYETSSSDIVFQGLEPNSYTLEVKSVTENGLESQIHRFSFVINPPFYKTWWFYISCAIFIAISVVVIIQLNLRRLKNEKIILERTVQERTKEIVEQKNIIEEKNQEIMDSITYAMGIQKAILPDDTKLSDYFHDYMVLFEPKDIVSGDFYWANKKEEKYYFMAADCTGHGVPGAIMSVVGHTSLETTLKHTKEQSAGEFLDRLTKNLLDVLLQSEKYSVKDGMDVGLCIYDPKKNSLEYAGANNPLYLVRKKEYGVADDLQSARLEDEHEHYNLFEFKANKQPIGDYDHHDPFETHSIKLQEGDTVYVFSDGFPDQFGGPKGKKYMYKPFKRLLLSLQELPLSEQKQRLKEELTAWMEHEGSGEKHEQIDDVLVFGVKFSN